MGVSIEGGMQLTAPCFSKGLILGDTEQPKQTIYEQSATQQYQLGTKLWYSDGRVFRYAKNGTVALSKAYMTSGPAIVANCYDIVQTGIGGNVAIGDQEIVVLVTDASAITDDLYAEGFVVANKSTGMGDIYKILACKLLTATTARLLLESPIRTAWSATTEIQLTKSSWRDVVVFPTTPTREAAGVPLIDVTIGYYCWLQRGGLAPLIFDAGDTLVAGEKAGAPATAAAAGCVGAPADVDQVWGTVAQVGEAGEVAVIDLTLDS